MVWSDAYGRNENVVICDYNFIFYAYESNINDIPLLKNDLTIKIHHFYNRLRGLQNIAKTGLRLFENAKELDIRQNDVPKDVKVLDGNALGSYFHHFLNEYEQLEVQAFNLGTELLKAIGNGRVVQ